MPQLSDGTDSQQQAYNQANGGTSGGYSSVGAPSSQGQGTASGLGGAFQNLVGEGNQVVGPNNKAYGSAYDQFGTTSEQAAHRGMAAQNIAAPSTVNADAGQSQANLARIYAQQSGLLGSLNNTIAGNAPSAATAQFGGATDANIAQAMAAQGNARGTGIEGAAHNAMGAAAMQQAQATQALGQGRLNERTAAMGNYGGVANQQGQLQLGQYGTEEEQALKAAQIQQAQQSQNDQYSLANFGMQNNAQQAQLGALSDYSQDSLSAQQLQQKNASANVGVVGSLGSGLASIAALL